MACLDGSQIVLWVKETILFLEFRNRQDSNSRKRIYWTLSQNRASIMALPLTEWTCFNFLLYLHGKGETTIDNSSKPKKNGFHMAFFFVIFQILSLRFDTSKKLYGPRLTTTVALHSKVRSLTDCLRSPTISIRFEEICWNSIAFSKK